MVKMCRIAIAVLAGAATSVASASPGDTWAMWQGDAAHSGYAPDTVHMSALAYAWSRQVQNGAIVGLAASGSAVFTTTYGGTYTFSQPASLVAQDLATGVPIWSIDTGIGVSYGEPAYAAGKVYVEQVVVADDDSDPVAAMVCYDATSGAELWRSPLTSAYFPYGVFFAPTVADGAVFAIDTGASPPMLKRIDASSGALDWSVAIENSDSRGVTAAGGLLYSMAIALSIVDPADGALLGDIDDPGLDDPNAGPRTPTVIGDVAYATGSSDLLVFDVPDLDLRAALAIHASGQIATDGAEIFVLSAGALSVRDAASGALHWGFEAPQPGPGSSGLLSDNMVVLKSHVVVTDGTDTYFVNRATHQIERHYEIGGRLAYAGDKLLIGDENGNVTAFALPSDELFSNGFDR